MKSNHQLEREIGQLEQQNKLLRDQITRMRKDPGDIPFTACDHSCVCATATGMATNGGCRCDETKLRRAVQYWRAKALYAIAQLNDKTAISNLNSE